MMGSVYGYVRCKACGLSVPASVMQAGNHTCMEENIISHQTTQFRTKFDKEREVWGSDERLKKFRDFYAWLDRRRAPTSGSRLAR